MGSTMIVEFIGTPGAGKTTFMPVVSEHFKKQNFQPFTVLEAARPFASRTSPGRMVQMLPFGRLRRFLLWQIFYRFSYTHRRKFAEQNQTLMQTVMNYQHQRPISESDKEHVLRWFLHLTGSYQFLKSRAQPGEMLLFDEGFVHRVVQLFASEMEQPDLDSVAHYLDLIPKPDLIIFPSASRELCEKRVFERGVWERFRAKGHQETSRFIMNAYKIVKYAVKRLRIKGWTVIEVDNNRDNLAEAKTMLEHTLSDLVIFVPETAGLTK